MNILNELTINVLLCSDCLHTCTHTVATNCRFFFVAHVDNNLDTPLNSCTIPTPACLSFQSILLQVIWFLVGNREPSFPNCVAMQDWKAPKDDSHDSEDT